MSISSELLTEVTSMINSYGSIIRIRYFNKAFAAGSWSYDDEITLSQSGSDFWTSGVVQPIRDARGSHEAELLQQGLIRINDSKLYVIGTVNTSGTWRVGIGSPPTNEYVSAKAGVESWSLNGSPVYKTLFITRLTTGSIMGE